MKRRYKKVLLLMAFVLFLLLFFTGLLPLLNFTFTSSELPQKMPNVTIIGHRGAAALAPENTLASFKKAMDIGVDVIELDVHLSSDDSVIVIHDHKVNRTTDGKGDIEDLSYADIKKLDGGSWFNASFKGEKIPTLDEVFKLVNGKVKVLVELKWPRNGIYQNLVKQVLQIIRNNNAEDWVIIQSFEKKYLQELNAIAPEIWSEQLIVGKASIIPVYYDRSLKFGYFKCEPYVKAVNPFYLYLSKGFVKKMHDENKKVYVWTIDSESKMIKAVNLGADGIITNHPEIAVKLFRQS